MEPTFSQFFQSNNKLAYTGEDKQKHPTLRITDKNDERICNFKLPLGTTFTAGRTWEGNTTENFITLTDKDGKSVSAKVVSICNKDNKNVTVVAEKPTLFTGWPAWHRGDEQLKIATGMKEEDRSFTINRCDNRPITHKCTKEIHFKFGVIWPTPPLSKRAETLVNNEPQETLQCDQPQETITIDETFDYIRPASGAGRAGGAAGGAGAADGAGAGADPDEMELDEEVKELSDNEAVTYPDFVTMMKDNNVKYNNIDVNATKEDGSKLDLPTGRTNASNVYFAMNPMAQLFVSNLIKQTEAYKETEPKQKGMVVAKALRVCWNQVTDEHPSMKTTMSNLSKDLNKTNKKIKQAAKVQAEALAIAKKKAAKAAKRAKKAKKTKTFLDVSD